MFSRYLIIQLLIVNILFSNLAWAVDECAYLFNHSDQYASVLVNQLDNASEDDTAINSSNTSTSLSCDSHCFANIRLTYVSYHLFDIHFVNSDTDITSIQRTYHSIQGQPPIKPPRV